jgi:hypothetical protein
MSLPAGQQRVLDDIEDALRASEPRLDSMYAMFTRLTKNELRPRREELSAGRIRLGGLRHCLSVRAAINAITPKAWGPVPRALLVAHFITILAALGVLIGLTVHTVRGACTNGLAVHAALMHTRAGCRDQAAHVTGPVPK